MRKTLNSTLTIRSKKGNYREIMNPLKHKKYIFLTTYTPLKTISVLQMVSSKKRGVQYKKKYFFCSLLLKNVLILHKFLTSFFRKKIKFRFKEFFLENDFFLEL